MYLLLVPFCLPRPFLFSFCKQGVVNSRCALTNFLPVGETSQKVDHLLGRGPDMIKGVRASSINTESTCHNGVIEFTLHKVFGDAPCYRVDIEPEFVVCLKVISASYALRRAELGSCLSIIHRQAVNIYSGPSFRIAFRQVIVH